jgi:hypothetical protein
MHQLEKFKVHVCVQCNLKFSSVVVAEIILDQIVDSKFNQSYGRKDHAEYPSPCSLSEGSGRVSGRT